MRKFEGSAVGWERSKFLVANIFRPERSQCDGVRQLACYSVWTQGSKGLSVSGWGGGTV